ncbi:MAG: FG-GAP repeat protein, partial [Anaerolineae bacterium]|nr:FG-GAP repeat protein [Anaerolineae bacterium]
MSTRRFMLTGLLLIALLAPGAAASTTQLAAESASAASAPADDNYPPPDWTYGPATGTLAAAGDVNGDGFDDALIVDPQNAPWTPVTARLFYGSPDGLPTEPDWSLADNWQTCPAGDVNGDGYDDLFTASLDGLQVFYGSPSGPVPAAPWHGASVSLSGAGDVNGDGYDDLLVGDPYFTDGQEWEGQMLLYYGSPTGPSTEPDWTLQSDEAGRRMGEQVLTAGDINGDGYGDIAFLSFRPSRYGSYRMGTHTLSIYLGSSAGPETTVHWTTTRYGTVTVTAGDIDGDGYDDLVIGEPGFPCNSYSCSGPGRVSVFRGSEGGLTTSSWRYEGGGGSRQLGKALTTAGDLNRDGYDDLIVGAASSTSSGQPIGQVLAFYGSSLGLASTPHWTAQHGEGSYGFGDRLALTGDVNGDGYDDLLAGNSANTAGCTDCDLVRGFYGSAAGLRGSRILVRLVDQPPSIDGDLDDWTQLAGFTLDRTSAATLAGQPAQPSDAAASLQAVWTAADLYLALHITDDAIVSDSPEVWNDDEIELGFYAVWDGNPAGGDTHQYTVNADGRVSDFGDPTVSIPVEAVAVPAPGGWDVEVRIPSNTLYGFHHQLTAGTTFSFNLGLHDDDDGGNWDSYLVWQGTATVGGDGFGAMFLTTE